MFDIGFWELVLIFVIALVVLGPERLPFAIRSVARFIGNARRMANVVKDELSQELHLQELKDDLEQAKRNEIGLHAAMQEVKSTLDETGSAYERGSTATQNSRDAEPVVQREKETEPPVVDAVQQQQK